MVSVYSRGGRRRGLDFHDKLQYPPPFLPLLCFPLFPSLFFREFGDTEVQKRGKRKRQKGGGKEPSISGSMLRIKGGEEEGIKGSLSFIEDTFLCLCASCCPLFTSLPRRYSRSRQNIADTHRREKGKSSHVICVTLSLPLSSSAFSAPPPPLFPYMQT